MSQQFKMDDELYHHGILGMHWGVRRSQAQLGHPAKKSKPNDSSSKKEEPKKEVPKKRTSHDMTEEELRSAIDRKRLENDYNNLYPEKVSAGKKFVNSMVKNVIVPAATDASKQLVRDFIIKEGRNALNLQSGNDNNKKKDS